MFGLASLFVYFSWKIVNVRNFNQGQPSAGRALFQKRWHLFALLLVWIAHYFVPAGLWSKLSVQDGWARLVKQSWEGIIPKEMTLIRSSSILDSALLRAGWSYSATLQLGRQAHQSSSAKLSVSVEKSVWLKLFTIVNSIRVVTFLHL